MLNVFLRKSLGKIFKNISKPEIDFDLNKAKNSLDQSLRRLKRDLISCKKALLYKPDEILDIEVPQRKKLKKFFRK